MKLKPGVRILGIRPEMVVCLQIAECVYEEHGAELVVTSVIDGQHSYGSLHYQGAAVDLRNRDLRDSQAVAADLMAALGEDFDVVSEDDHIHIEFQPKAAY